MSNTSSFVILFFTVFLDLIGFGIVLPLLPNYARELGASPLLIGIVAGSYSLMQFFSAPLWGTISDRIGRRPVILISVATSTVSYLIFSQSHTVWLLLLSRILAGIGSANVGVTQAYIADITTFENRSKSLGILGAAFGLGFVLGPPIGGIVKSAYGIEAVGYIAALLTGLDLLLAYFLLPESLKEKKSGSMRLTFLQIDKMASAFQHPALSRLLIIGFCFVFAFVNMQISVPLLWREHYALTDKAIGYLFALVGIISVIVQGGLIGRLSRHFGERKVLTAGLATMCVGITLIPFVPEGWLFPAGLFVLTLLAIGNGLVTPVNTSLISLYAKPEEQGELLGVAQSIGSLGRILGPLSGSLFYGLDPHAPYLVGGSFLLVGLFLSLALFSLELAPPLQAARVSAEAQAR
ncbi:MAG: MFS transporter [Chloroherpetonaceae bacterium]|nr:MFS transporter [Chloroherpetonaceae bacterium]MDW8467010.1 MFS transporter [Chloroherpetonaceae bacterium]